MHSEVTETLVSIITTTYNSERTILDALKSVGSQQYKNIEHIIIDGASSDSTLGIIADYKKRSRYPVKIVSESDDGIYWAMNKGVDLASGQLIGILNSDDFLEPDALKTIVTSWIKAGKPDIVAGKTSILNDRGFKQEFFSVPRIDYDKDIVAFPHPSTYVAASTYRVHGNYDTSLSYASDRDFFCRLIGHGCTYTTVDRTIANFRQGGKGSRIGITGQLENIKIDLRHFGFRRAVIRGFFDAINWLLQEANRKRKKLLKVYRVNDNLG
jgi:glycosyltransferase involved in cell wall biosynthesis